VKGYQGIKISDLLKRDWQRTTKEGALLGFQNCSWRRGLWLDLIEKVPAIPTSGVDLDETLFICDSILFFWFGMVFYRIIPK